MRKTTLYLPDELKRALQRAAEARSCSEAELVREAIKLLVSQSAPPPRLPLIESGQPDLAEQVEQLLNGFGER